MNDDRTAPSLTHMEKAQAVWHARNAPSLTERIALALAAEHDAALESAAVRCEEVAVAAGHTTRGRTCRYACAIRAMKEGQR